MKIDTLTKRLGGVTFRFAILTASLSLALVVAFMINGCGGTTRAAVELPHPNTSVFLSLGEQQALDSASLEEYCGLLNGYLEELRGEIELAKHYTDSLNVEMERLNAEHSRINREKRDIQKELRLLKGKREGRMTYETKEGDTLMTLSTLFYGNAAQWRKIFQENEDKVEDPGKPLPVGTKLVIPN
jgi:nucleoid-associated protein YgaU